jgi:hypothetical protein
MKEGERVRLATAACKNLKFLSVRETAKPDRSNVTPSAAGCDSDHLFFGAVICYSS